jgi:hypothetical protein
MKTKKARARVKVITMQTRTSEARELPRVQLVAEVVDGEKLVALELLEAGLLERPLQHGRLQLKEDKPQ